MISYIFWKDMIQPITPFWTLIDISYLSSMFITFPYFIFLWYSLLFETILFVCTYICFLISFSFNRIKVRDGKVFFFFFFCFCSNYIVSDTY